MIVFIAGAARTAKIERNRVPYYTTRLVSYYWASIEEHLDNIILVNQEYGRLQEGSMKKVDLFLDSGAFSAWSKGVEIKVEDYIAFIKKHDKFLSMYAVLDVIGDAAATLENQRIMEKAGLTPMPCFHFGEPLSFLQKYIDEYDYIALGGLAKKGQRPELFDFLDRCFELICDKDGMPKIKVHGFGVTGMNAMKRYPWYSVDSTSWLLASRMGRIIVPHKLPDGQWDYLETLPNKNTRRIAVSTISPASGVPDQHISTASSQWQNEVAEWLALHDTQLGKSKFRKVPAGYELKENERWAKQPGVGEREDDQEDWGNTAPAGAKDYIEIVIESGVSNNYVERDIINAKYFKELEGKFPKWPWAWQRPRRRGFGF